MALSTDLRVAFHNQVPVIYPVTPNGVEHSNWDRQEVKANAGDLSGNA